MIRILVKKTDILALKLILLVVFLIACVPNNNTKQILQVTVTPPVIFTQSPTVQQAPIKEPLPSDTPPLSKPTSTGKPSTAPAVQDRLLDWQNLTGLPERAAMFAFDGEWLVTVAAAAGDPEEPLRFSLFTSRQKGVLKEAHQVIIDFPAGKMASNYESGSGLEVAGGRAAVVVVDAISDSASGYELWLVNLESGKKEFLKRSERSFPSIALSERWLVLHDSSTDFPGSEHCLEAYRLPGGPFMKIWCTHGRLQWPVLDGNVLAYQETEPGQECPSVIRKDMETGERATYQPNNCLVGLQIDTSQTTTIWPEVLPDGKVLVSGMDTFSGPFTLERSQWGFNRVCGRSVYYQVEHQGAMELRVYQPGGREEALLRYHPLAALPAGMYSHDETLPVYNLEDFQCGSGWLAIWTSEGQLLAARDANQ